MNVTLLPNNKMTKSYLLESDPYLKTSSKTSPFALNSDESTVYRGANVWTGGHNHHSNTIPGDLFSDRPTVKPLAMHNVPSNVPPIAYINGNSVRPVRCRHYSQQQTVFHNGNGSGHHGGGGQHTHSQQHAGNSGHGTSSEKRNSGTKVAAGDMHYVQSKLAGINEFGGDGTSDRDSSGSQAEQSGQLAPKSTSKVKVQFADSHQSSSSSGQQQQRSSQSPVKQRSKSPSRQSPSSLRDYVTNNDDNENESSIFSVYENTGQVIDHLAKRIEGVLRTAKESRRLVCNELLVPQVLTSQIATEVLELAECEPCGLRGCLLYICIEDNTASSSSGGQAAGKQPPKSATSDHSHSAGNHSVASRLLGELALDRSVVPTFEVFLTLKRASPSWFDSLENKLLGKERIVLSELYLLHKKKLYQTPSSPTM